LAIVYRKSSPVEIVRVLAWKQDFIGLLQGDGQPEEP
jgi:hypothetical protein